MSGNTPRVTVTPSPKLGIPVIEYWSTTTDPRGPFAVPYEAAELETAGLRLPALVQTNVSVSTRPNTIRGIHVSNRLKYVASLGGFMNVVVCLDKSSPLFGKHEWFDLSLGRALVVPAGWGNALVNDAPNAVYFYSMDGPYDAASERVISPLDPDLDIRWRNWRAGTYEMSDRDRAGSSLPKYLLNPTPGGSTDPARFFAS